MKPFEVIEHTADIGIRAFGKDLNELFINSALGMFSLIHEKKKISRKKEIKIELSSGDREGLLIQWLNELLYHFTVKKFIPKTFDIRINRNRLSAVVQGEHYNSIAAKMEVKAATYHQLEVIPPSFKDPSFWQAKIIFDV